MGCFSVPLYEECVTMRRLQDVTTSWSGIAVVQQHLHDHMFPVPVLFMCLALQTSIYKTTHFNSHSNFFPYVVGLGAINTFPPTHGYYIVFHHL